MALKAQLDAARVSTMSHVLKGVPASSGADCGDTYMKLLSSHLQATL